jgi:hypothetical protein
MVILCLRGRSEYSLLQQAAHLEQLVAIDAAHRAAGDVADVVAAGAGGGEPALGENAQDLRQAGELQPVKLEVLPRRQLAVAAAEALRDPAEDPQLGRREKAAGQFHPHHEVPELRLVVVQAVPLHAHEVLFGYRFVAGLDHGRQIVNDGEAALLVLQPLHEIALVNQVPGDFGLGLACRHRKTSRAFLAERKLASAAGSAVRTSSLDGLSGEKRMRTARRRSHPLATGAMRPARRKDRSDEAPVTHL